MDLNSRFVSSAANPGNTGRPIPQSRRLLSVCSALSLAVCCAAGQAATITVPSVSAPTIQAAIGIAVNGDDILVAPGTYFESINFGGKAIWVHSAAGANVTIINGSTTTSPVARFVTGEGPASVLQGFTITGGLLGSNASGAGVRIQAASPTIQDCTVSGNNIQGFLGVQNGAGIAVLGGSPLIRRCTITNNDADIQGGGGIALMNCTATVHDCTVSGNRGGNASGFYIVGGSPVITRCIVASNGTITNTDGPGAFGVYGGGTPSITNCLIRDNLSSNSAGGVQGNASPSFINCTFWNNDNLHLTIGRQIEGSGTLTNCIVWTTSAPAVTTEVGAGIAVTYSDVMNGHAGVGNITVYPQFVSATDFRLTHTSPCLDAGNNPAYFGSPAAVFTDLAGNARGTDMLGSSATGVGISPIIDMGAYEYECYVNCDHSTTWPYLNVLDFSCFLNKFAAGCP